MHSTSSTFSLIAAKLHWIFVAQCWYSEATAMLVLVIYAAARWVVRYYTRISGGHPPFSHILMSPNHGHLILTLWYTHHRHHQYNKEFLRVCIHNGSGCLVHWHMVGLEWWCVTFVLCVTNRSGCLVGGTRLVMHATFALPARCLDPSAGQG